MEELRELVRVAEGCNVDLVFTLSPGLDFVYSSRRDARFLLAKLQVFTGLGCKWVGLFLDDIVPDLNHDADKKAFSSLGEAHVCLLNHVHDELGKGDSIRFAFCPTYYANNYLGKRVAENEYLQEIGDDLDPRIDVLWTGSHVVSTRITLDDVVAYEKVVKRKPFLWDNYPVNDYYRSGDAAHDRPRLNIGPFSGRSPKIIEHLAGYVSNPMNESEASKIPLLTLSDYLDHPFTYSPKRSFERAFRNLFSGETCCAELKLLAECSRASPLLPREAEELRELVRELIESFGRPDDSSWAGSSAALESRLKAYAALKGRLFLSLHNRKFLSESEPVVGKVQKLASLGLSCLELAERARERPRNQNEVNRLKQKVRTEMEHVRKDRTQALGEIVFEESLSEMGLPRVHTESPVNELCRWSSRIARLGHHVLLFGAPHKTGLASNKT
jgi:hyaluronoglucosaminidase